MAAAAAMSDLFAPAYIHGNPGSEAAVAQWQAEQHGVTPEMIEATRGPDKIITNPGVGGMGQSLRGGVGSTTSTIEGSVDPEILRIYAQGGKYTPPTPLAAPQAAVAAPTPEASAQRDAITGTLLGTGRIPNAAAGSLIAPRTDTVPEGYQRAWSPLIGLMGEGDNSDFMQGSFAGGA